MVFSSWQFVLLFLPISCSIYFYLNRLRLIIAGKVWLVASSLFFYAYWDIRYLALILASILLNFAIGTGLAQSFQSQAIDLSKITHGLNRKVVLTTGISANLLLLGYYKYSDFFLANVNSIFATSFALPHIVLPLAISFFTFTQIVYLVDSYRGETAEYDLLNYSLFVTFFPHLIAGPIVHHRQIMPQFFSRWKILPRYTNIAKGLFIFAIGIFKKSVLADTLAIWARAGFDGTQPLNFFSAWAASLSYSLQLYFDFSGYCDMAIGASLLFNVWLPVNFNSPYKALDIQDFWRRWHITLSNFLRDYLYIPLGGNRHGPFRTYGNIFVVFVLGGLWHGATWMYVIWGALHGGALIGNRLWKKYGYPMPKILAWGITFLFVNFAWVFFRASNMASAKKMLKAMFLFKLDLGNTSDFALTADLAWAGWMSDHLLTIFPATLIGQLPALFCVFFAFILLRFQNSIELIQGSIRGVKLAYGVLLFTVAMYCSLATTSSVFLYFNF